MDRSNSSTMNTLTLHPEITFYTTPSGCRAALARYPVAMALRARHLPAMTHQGTTYVPYTGDVVAPYRHNVTPERPEGYYLEYRALRSTRPAV